MAESADKAQVPAAVGADNAHPTENLMSILQEHASFGTKPESTSEWSTWKLVPMIP